VSKKREVQQAWLEAAMKLYDTGDEHEQRMLFARTCKSASSRFTAKELEEATRDMRYWIEKGQTG